MPSINFQTNTSTENNTDNVDGEEQKPEPTLTDHLNKKLLNSFLNRINSGDANFNQLFNSANPSENKNGEDFA